MTVHAGHDTIEAIAAVVLWLAGVVALASAVRDGRAGRGKVAPFSPADGGPAARRAVLTVVAALSLGAAMIHLAAAPKHVEELGDIGLGFYLAALFQAGWVVTFLAHPSARRAAIGIAGNAAITIVWIWTRTVGLRFGADTGQPESIGVPDAVATALQVGLILLLGAGLARRPRRMVDLRAAAASGATVVAVPLVGIVFLATTLAVSVAVGGQHAGSGEHLGASTYVVAGGVIHGADAP